MKELKDDLRALGKYDVLNKSYPLENGYTFGIKATKKSCMAMQITKDGNLCYRRGGFYDGTQKMILEEAEKFIEGIESWEQLKAQQEGL